MPSVYLAGPITGLSYDGSIEWRSWVKHQLEPDIKTFSPMRGKDYLKNVDKLAGTFEEYGKMSALSTSKGIITRDCFDANRVDALFINLLGAKSPSLGTVMEIAWGYLARKPMIGVMEESGNPHEHGMITEALTYRVTSLQEAVHFAKILLL